jgi:hypothetical protein
VLGTQFESFQPTEISRFLAKSPELAGLCGGCLVSAKAQPVPKRRFTRFVSGLKNSFPRKRRLGSQRLGSNAELLGRKAEDPVLPRPFSREVREAGNPHAMRELALEVAHYIAGCFTSSGSLATLTVMRRLRCYSFMSK